MSKILDEGNRLLAEKGMAFTGATPDAGNSPRITREYLDAILVEWRMIDAVEASTAMDLFGESFRTPIMVAALSGLDRIRPTGMVEVARGAAEAGAAMWAGIGDADELRAIIDTGVKTVKIVKPYRDEELIFRKLEHAERCGAFAVGMDIDFVFGRKNGAAPFPMAPKTLAQITSYVAATRLPFVLKGVLSEMDAGKAVEAGAAGIVVSHHGGAVMDYAPPPLLALPKIAARLNRRIPAFVDCGIARGMDAFKALALGATAVSAGKAVMAGLAAGGAAGVTTVLNEMTEELRRAMSLAGAAHPRDIDPEVLLFK